MTDEEFLEKMMFEGGVYPAFEYGLKPSDLNEDDSEIYELVEDAYHHWEQAADSVYGIEYLMREYEV